MLKSTSPIVMAAPVSRLKAVAKPLPEALASRSSTGASLAGLTVMLAVAVSVTPPLLTEYVKLVDPL